MLTAEPVALGIGIILLGGGFIVFLAAATISMARAVTGVTATGIRLAGVSLAVTIVLGLALVLNRAGWWLPPAVEAAINTHVVFGLLGWVLLLVMGVAYQVVPMFQITPPYPPRLSRWLAGTMFVLLVLHAAASPFFPAARVIVDSGLAGGILVFAVTTLRLQARRRRKLPDVSLDFWRLGMASLIACVLVWFSAQIWPAWGNSPSYPLLLGVLFIGGFTVSVVSGMLYKIVPFLAWFHLQAQLQARAGSIPTMKDMIAERSTRGHFRVHTLACVMLATAVFNPPALALPAGIMLGLSALFQWVNLLSAVRRFSNHGGRFT